MRIAFKEWAVVVDALGRGDQMILLRKGGISEGKRGFQMGHGTFLFFPTRFHQQRESVIASAQARYDDLVAAFPAEDVVRLEYWGEVAAWQKISDPEFFTRMRGQHVWRDEVIAKRYEWGPEQGIVAIALKVHRLPGPVEIPMLESYGGCKSWVELDEEISLKNSVPVLEEYEFRKRLKTFRDCFRE